MTIVGRATLINSSLTRTFIYRILMYLLPIIVTKKLDKQRRLFFWEGNGLKKKISYGQVGLDLQKQKKRG